MPGQQPSSGTPRKPPSRGVNAFVRAERLFQIALILPAAVFVGWLIGAALDRWLHQHWIYLAGIILGCIAGFIDVLRIISVNTQDPS
jgi:F0F1-type ATP synthase assembly protein I